MKKIILILLLCIFLFTVSSCEKKVNKRIDNLEKLGYNVKVLYPDNNNEYSPIIQLYIERYDDFGCKWAYVEQFKTKEAADLKFKSKRFDAEQPDGTLAYNIGLNGKWVAWGSANAVYDALN